MKKNLFFLLAMFISVLHGYGQALQQDFEGSPPSLPIDWAVTGASSDGIWNVGNTAQASSDYLEYPAHTTFAYTNDDECDCDKSADRLISPSMDVSGYSALELRFDYFYYRLTGVGSFTVEASTDGGTTWTELSSLEPGNSWQNGQIIDLSAYAGESDLKISFLYNDGDDWNYGAAVDNVVVDVPLASCTGTPDAGIASTSPSTGGSGVNVTLSATGYSSGLSGLSYQWEYQFIGGDPWTNFGSVTASYSDVIGTITGPVGTIFEARLKVSCSNSGLFSYSTTATYEVVPDYCIPSSTSTSDYLSAIASSGAVSDLSYSTSSFPTGGYDNQTSLHLETYELQTFEITTTFVGGANGVNIWVDWDNDKIFDSSEIVASLANSSATKTHTITIPSGQSQGDYRMRVRAQYGSSANPDSCGSINWGSAVDFTLTLVTPPSCLPPTELATTSIGTDNADIAWLANGPEGSWNISWGAPGYTPGVDDLGTDTADATSFQITGLMQNTSYAVYVQADCSGDLSAWTGPLNLTTSCSFTTVPYVMDFETAVVPNLPVCTSRERIGTIGLDWRTSSSSAAGFNAGNKLNYSYHPSTPAGRANAWFYTQGIQLEAGVDYDISYKYGNNTTFYTESMKVAYGTSPNEAAMTTELADHPSINTTTALDGLYTFTVPEDGVYYFGFNAYSIQNQNQLYVDDISIFETPECPNPSNLSVSNIGETSVDLDWDHPGANYYNLIVREVDGDQYEPVLGDITDADIENHPFTKTNLLPNTTYEFYVIADCDMYWSNFVGPVSFTTLAPPPANDEACGATVLACGDVVTQSLLGATASIEDSCFGTGSADVWFTFIVDGTQAMTVSETSSLDAIVHLFMGDDCGNLQEVGACKDSPENYTVTEEGTYYFRVRPYSLSGNTGTITVSLTCANMGDNYSCDSAIALECNADPVTYTSVGSTAVAPLGCSIGANGIWFSFMGTGAAITINSTASFDHKMSMQTGTCGELTWIDCKDGSTGAESYTLEATVANQMYYVYVAHFSTFTNGTGNITIGIECAVVPECTSPEMTLAIQDANGGSINCLDAGGEYYVLATLSGGEGNTSYNVSANGGDAIEVNADDSVVLGPFTVGTDVSVTAVGAQDEACSVSASIDSPAFCPPSNDEACGASVLACGDEITQSLDGATASIDDSCGGTGTADVWFTFTSDGTQIMTVRETSSLDVVIQLFKGDDCGNLEEVMGCLDFPEGFGLAEGDEGTYYFRVRPYSSSGNTGTISVSLTCVDRPTNENCDSAIVLECNADPVTYSSVGSTAVAPVGCDIANYGLWFSFAGTGADITINSTANFDHEMSILTGSCGELTSIACRDSSTGAESYTVAATVANQMYYVYVAHYSATGTTTGNITIGIDCAVVPECTSPEMTLAVQDANGGSINCLDAGGEFYVLATLSGGEGNTSYNVSANGGDAVEVDADDSVVLGPFTVGTNVNVSAVGAQDDLCGATASINSPAFCPPVNDNCEGAIVLECNAAPMTYSSVGSTATSPSGCTIGQNGLWFSFVGTGADITIKSSANFDHKMSMQTGSCGDLTWIACQDSALAGGTETYTIEASVANQMYYVYVAQWNSSSTITGNITIGIECAVVPECTSPEMTLAVQDANGGSIDCLDFAGEYFVLATLSGGEGNTSYNVSANGEDAGEVDADGSVVLGPFAAGTDVSVIAVGVQDGDCSVTESIDSPVFCPPANDECVDAIALSCGDSIAGTTVNATDSGLGNPSCASGTPHDVFYTLDVQQGNEYTVSVVGADYDAVLVLYSGVCGQLTEIDCADNGFSAGVEESITFTASATETITIRTYDWSPSQGSFTISVTCEDDPSIPASEYFVTTWTTTTANETITIPTSGSGYDYLVEWGDGSSDTGMTGNATHAYAEAGTYTVKIHGDFPRIFFNLYQDRQKIQSIEQWGNIQWTSMNSAFMGATNLVSNATDMPDLSLVTDMYGMFGYTEAFNGDSGMGAWDVSNVTNMHGMFGGAFSFNADISNWDVGNVRNMKLMFSHAYSFNQDIGNWDVGSVTNMDSMFRVSSDFDQDLGAWNVSNVVNMTNMLKDVTLSTANYDALLNGWNTLTLKNNVKFHAGNSTYCNGEIARQNIIATYNWTITDGGMNCGGDEDRLDGDDNKTLADIVLYPNPMRNKLILGNPKNVQLDSASIYDLTGRLITTVDLKGMASEMELDVTGLSSATYMVIVNGQNGGQVTKLMVKE